MLYRHWKHYTATKLKVGPLTLLLKLLPVRCSFAMCQKEAVKIQMLNKVRTQPLVVFSLSQIAMLK